VQAKAINPELKESLAALGFFVLCAAAFFAFKIAQGYVLAPEDDFVQNYPAFACPLGLWTPLLLTGFPVLADPQVQFFYPLAWLAKHIPLGADLAVNFNLFIILAFVLAAYFAFLLARRLTGSFYAGMLAGLSYGFSGYFISELKHVQILHTALWLPLLLLLIEASKSQLQGVCARPKEDSDWKPLCVQFFAVLLCFGLVVACMIFAGHPQTALYLLVTALSYVIFLAVSLPDTKIRVLFLLSFLLALASGIAISAVQLLPSMELSALSGRSAFTFRDFVIGQVEPMQVVGFVIPYVMGGYYGTLGNIPFSEQGPPPGLLFVGFAPLLLALYGAINNKDERKRIWFFVVLAIFAFILSLGALTPLSRLIYVVPFFGSFRGLYRVLILVTFSVSMLAAFGLAQLEKDFTGETPLKQSLEPGKLGRSKHFYLLLYLSLCCFSYPFLLGSLPLLLFFIKINRLQFLYRLKSALRQKFLLLAAVVALCSYAFNAEWSKASPLASDFKTPQIAMSYRSESAKSNSRIFTIRGLEGDREQLPPNLSRLWGVASATGYEPLVSRRYSSLLGISEGGFLQPPWRIKGANRAFDITCVKYIFAPWGDFSKFAFDDAAKKKWKLKEAAGKTLVYENSEVLPRFYLVPQAKSYAPEAVRLAIITGQLPDGTAFDPKAMVLIDDHRDRGVATSEPKKIVPKVEESLPSAVEGPGLITRSDLGDERLLFEISMAKSGYFVLADMFYPGWQATVDGKPTEILPANYVQRAVFLGPGSHAVVFKYSPEPLARGKIIFVMAAFLWAVILAIGVVWMNLKR
jgi:hypothetical protein